MLKQITTKILNEKLEQPRFYLQAICNNQNNSVIDDLQIELKLHDIVPPRDPAIPNSHKKSGQKQYDPTRHVYFTKQKANELESYMECVKHIEKTSLRERYIASPKSKILWSTLAALCPISLRHLELIAATTIQIFLSDNKLLPSLSDPELNDRIAKAFSPSQSFLRNVIHEGACIKLAILRKKIKGKNIAGGFDKANKKGVPHFVKFKCFWDDENDCAVFYLLDADGAAGKTIDASDSINFSMTRIDFTELPKTKLGAQMTDAGGGGVGSDLARALDTKNRITDITRYLQPTCALHGWQLALSNPIQRLIGEGSLNAMNAMQLLHSAYNLQEGGGGVFQVSSFKKLWQKLYNEKHKKIREPILSRW